MSQNLDDFYESIFETLRAQKIIDVEVLHNGTWQQRLDLFDKGQANMASLCGLYYTRRLDQAAPCRLIVAPVMAGERYQNRPFYYSEALVRNDSKFATLNDLRGTRLAINEKESHSGYNIVKYLLGAAGVRGAFFREVIESGSHLTSLDMIESGEADVAAIDTTVLEWVYQTKPETHALFRSIRQIGPSPMPPIATHNSIPFSRVNELQKVLTNLHLQHEFLEFFQKNMIQRFDLVEDNFYDPIRIMDRIASRIDL